MDIKDILNKDNVNGALNEAGEVVSKDFDNLEGMVVAWSYKGESCLRFYGEMGELVSLLEQAKFLIMRDNLGEVDYGRGD